jgi:hypothetical protein
MAGRKTFSIGITINLDNYENLRLDVSGEVEDQHDTEEFIRFLDQTLERLGRGNVNTAARVDSYRRRVFTLPEGGKEAPVAPPSAEKPWAAQQAPEAPPMPKKEAAPAVVSPGQVAEAPAPAPAATPASKPAARPVEAPKPQGEFVCEECQGPVTKSQQQISQLFQGKTLCKKCMKTP